jgi:hypothetical protein
MAFWSAWHRLRAPFVNGSWKCIQIFTISISEDPIFPVVSEVKVKDSVRDDYIIDSGMFSLSSDREWEMLCDRLEADVMFPCHKGQVLAILRELE